MKWITCRLSMKKDCEEMIPIFSQPFLIYSSLKRGTKSMKTVHRRVIRITVRRESTVPYRIWAEAERP